MAATESLLVLWEEKGREGTSVGSGSGSGGAQGMKMELGQQAPLQALSQLLTGAAVHCWRPGEAINQNLLVPFD